MFDATDGCDPVADDADVGGERRGARSVDHRAVADHEAVLHGQLAYRLEEALDPQGKGDQDAPCHLAPLQQQPPHQDDAKAHANPG